MGYVPKNVPKGKRDKIRAYELETSILTAAAGNDVFITIPSGESLQVETYAGGTAIEVDDTTGKTYLLELDTDEINMDDDADLQIGGTVSTRNAADNSMYVPVAASLAHERLWKVAGKVTANNGGYFDALYANASTTTTATGGEIRGVEAKATILADMDAGSIATGVYAKVNVSGASAEVGKAIGVDVLLEEESSGTITEGTGIRVQGGAGAIHYGVDVSGDYGAGAIKMPYKSGAGVTDEILAAAGAFGVAEAGTDARVMGFHKDTADANKIYLVAMVEGQYVIALMTAAA